MRLVLRILGTLCLVSALVLGGYFAWLLWGTGLETARAQEDLRAGFAHRLEVAEELRAAPRPGSNGRPGPARKPPPAPEAVSFRTGEAVAIIKIAKIGLDMVVVEGTDLEELKRGPGHYEDSAFPWEATGRVGIAGHRTTYGRPFWSLDKLVKGDRIELVTEYGEFTYRVTKLEVHLPTAVGELAPTQKPTLVLTTCTPLFSASHRLFVYAERQ